MSNKFNTSNFSNFEIFNDENLGSVRTLTDENDQIWFLGNDVAECLGYTPDHYSHRLNQFTDESDRRVLKYCDSPTSGESKFWQNSADRKDKVFINEAGVYAMIFLSRKPKAIEFKDWILHTVIPSVREHGGYIIGQEKIQDKEAKDLLLTQIEDLSEQVDTLNIANLILNAHVKDLEEQNAELAAKIDALRAESDDAVTTLKEGWAQAKEQNAKLRGKYRTMRLGLKEADNQIKVLSARLIDTIRDCDSVVDILEKESKENIRLLQENMELKNPALAKKYKEAHSYSEQPIDEQYFVDADGSVSSDNPNKNRGDR